MDSSEETAIVKTFVVKEKRERLAGFLANPKRRKEATSSLAHFNDFDRKWIVGRAAALMEI
ncbi:MAG: hypothetical protein KGL74_08140 [Elusimicrobia bacterium]|nr:hypothetical protein [Elusimicrobiota bacterium]